MAVGPLEERFARRSFREMQSLERIIQDLSAYARIQVLDYVEHKGLRFPLYSLTLGSKEPSAPTLGFFGGVHGLEKIGSEVILSYLELVRELCRWDEDFKRRLETTRLVFMPIVNPVGIVQRSRANGNGVDIMRNSPLEAEPGPMNRIFSGHRISSKLPWYRGQENTEMEVESRALSKLVEQEIFPAKVSITIDVHSGFGTTDQLWFPFAHSRKPFPGISEMTSLKNLFDRTYPHHFYKIEPVSRNYLVNGDLWDYLFLNYEKSKKKGEQKGTFIPLTLEMGSWTWLKKNPRQIFDAFGLFHPILPHRHHRIMRRHNTLFDFLHRSIMYSNAWLELNEQQRKDLKDEAIALWYERK